MKFNAVYVEYDKNGNEQVLKEEFDTKDFDYQEFWFYCWYRSPWYLERGNKHIDMMYLLDNRYMPECFDKLVKNLEKLLMMDNEELSRLYDQLERGIL